jgi:hypothetical protein
MIEPLFDVIIHTAHDDGRPRFTAAIIDHYHPEPWNIPGSPIYDNLEDTIGWARGAVTAFMEAAETDTPVEPTPVIE